jgi:AraC-type DNA-binding domain-containing proteins
MKHYIRIPVNNEMDILKRIHNAYSNAVFISREEQDFKFGIHEERVILSCIKNADTDTLREFITSLPDGIGIGPLSQNEIRQLKYSFIGTTAIVTRAAINAGVSVVEAFSLSDIYTQYVDSLNSSEEIIELFWPLFVDFIDKVKAVKWKKESPLIRKCCDYISENLHGKINVSDLSGFCRCSSAYLTNQFKKELNKTPLEYITEQKTECAKDLLLSSNFSIDAIAAFLGYSSHSHFSSVFKRVNGVSPKEFKKIAVPESVKEQDLQNIAGINPASISKT